MDEMITFLTQFVIAYLLLGCLLVSAVALTLKLFSLNAAARHKIWLTALLVLAIMPALSFLPERAVDASQSSQLVADTVLITTDTRETGLQVDAYRPVTASLNLSPSIEASREGVAAWLSADMFSLTAVSILLLDLPLFSELVFFVGILLAFGSSFRLLSYVRSLRSLRELVSSAEAVEGEWADVLEQSCALMDMHCDIELRQSNLIATPSTCGVLKPCIILPLSMVRNGSFEDSRAQVLQHELAHIKRHDPLLASLQTIVSIFLFWHPAVSYANKRIRHEREIACDDWVVNNNRQKSNAAVKAYAYSMVNLAESLSMHAEPAHSVACVSNTLGLQERIRVLLDRGADHSTSVDIVPNVWTTFVALGFLFSASALLPKVELNLFSQGEANPAVSPLQKLPAIPHPISMIDDGAQKEREIGSLASAPSVKKLIDYATPLPIGGVRTNAANNTISAVQHRAARLESRLAPQISKAVFVNTPDIDSFVRAEARIAPLPLPMPFDEPVDQYSSLTGNSIELGQMDSNRNEWVIIENLSRSELAAEIQKIELEIYRVFNSVTDRDDLKIRCSTEAVLGSFIDQTICEPEFLRSVRSYNLRNSMGASGLKSFDMSIGLEGDMAEDYAELAAELIHEMKGNRYLLELYQVLTGLNGRMQELV